jgi:acyl dehydratase
VNVSISRFPVEAGHVLTFARSLGDTSAVYSDKEFAASGLGGVAAPPTFVQASAQFDPDYPLRPQPGQRWWGSPQPSDVAEPAQDGQADETSSVLHAEQTFDFVRPVRVGDVLTATQSTGKSWEKHGRKGGRMLFSELITEYYDAAGELVVRSTAVSVQTDTAPHEAEKPR